MEVGSQGGLHAISRGTIYSRGENLIHPVNVMDEHNIMLITVKVQAVFKGVCSSAVNREHARAARLPSVLQTHSESQPSNQACQKP